MASDYITVTILSVQSAMGISDAELARRGGVAPSAIAKIKRGKAITTRTAAKLFAALDLRVSIR